MQNTDARPLKELTAAAATARTALSLRSRPVVVRSEATAFAIAARCEGHAVMLGEDAFWVVCLSDAAKLEAAGYEFAPQP